MGDELLKASVKKKKDEKYRKRDPRSWENIIKATANMSPEEKLQHLETVYNELYNENRICNANLQAREKQYAQCLKEHEKDRAELSKSILAKGQLESLCRELQKQNKLIKEENVARIKEEEDRRREVANTFTERLNTLTNLITESKDKSNKVKEENQNMAQKLTELYEQYQQRESHLETVTKQLDLQKKLAETQAKKAEIEHEAEKQTFVAEKKTFELQLEQYQREVVLLQEKNRSLEAQVDLYKSQYTDFEMTMSKSSKVFDTFKEEMSKMSKQLHTLEAERNDVKKRWQSSVNSLIVLSEQHVALSKEQGALEKRLLMCQKLCRQLQEDRSAFLKQLKENNIVPVIPSVVNGDCNEEKQLETCKPQKTSKRNAEGKKAKKMSDTVSAILANSESTIKNENADGTSDILDHAVTECTEALSDSSAKYQSPVKCPSESGSVISDLDGDPSKGGHLNQSFDSGSTVIVPREFPEAKIPSISDLCSPVSSFSSDYDDQNSPLSYNSVSANNSPARSKVNVPANSDYPRYSPNSPCYSPAHHPYSDVSPAYSPNSYGAPSSGKSEENSFTSGSSVTLISSDIEDEEKDANVLSSTTDVPAAI